MTTEDIRGLYTLFLQKAPLSHVNTVPRPHMVNTFDPGFDLTRRHSRALRLHAQIVRIRRRS